MRKQIHALLILPVLFAAGLTAQQVGPSAPSQPVPSGPTVTVTTSIDPIYEGDCLSHFQGTLQTTKVYPGTVWSVPNGTSVSDLGLTITVDASPNSQGAFGYLKMSPSIPGFNTSEWQVGTMTPVPFDLTPTSGSFLDDTMHVIEMSGYVDSQWVDHMVVVITGDPNDADVSMDLTSNGTPVGGNLSADVGDSLDSLGLSFDIENLQYQGVGTATTFSNATGTGIDKSEFADFGNHTLTVPGATPSGTFNTAGTHTVTVFAWGVNQYASGSSWVYDYFADVYEFDVVVNADPRISVSDSTGAITIGDTAAGDRDFGSIDVSLLPTGWATITVANTGTGDLVLSDPTLAAPYTGAGASGFEFDLATYSQSVASGSSTSFGVRMSTGAMTGTNAAWVSITHNDSMLSGDFTFEVTGDVTSTPAIEISDSTGSFTSGAGAGGDRDFGQVDMSIMPATATITIDSTGTGSLLISSVTLSGPDAGDFVLDLSAMIATLSAGSSTNFDVWFDALTIGAKTATVTISHNAGADFTFEVAGVATTTNTPVITTTTLPDARQGESYTPRPIDATGGTQPYAFSVVAGALPSGMSLSSSGTVSGTPDVTGSYDFTVRVTDSVGAFSDQALTLNVAMGTSGGGSGSGGGCTAGSGLLIAPVLLLLVAGLALRRRRHLRADS